VAGEQIKLLEENTVSGTIEGHALLHRYSTNIREISTVDIIAGERKEFAVLVICKPKIIICFFYQNGDSTVNEAAYFFKKYCLSFLGPFIFSNGAEFG